MLSVKGIFQNGIAQPTHHISGHDGQKVIITFLDEDLSLLEPENSESDWDTLEKLVNDCKVNTGIPDLSHEHDHYVHNKPKRSEQ